MSNYVCYVIRTPNGRRTYVGITNDPKKRLRQHCGELSGGAKYTRGKTWAYAALVKGFESKSQVLSFEWWVKHQTRKCSGRPLDRRFKALRLLLRKQRWGHLDLGFLDKEDCKNKEEYHVMGKTAPVIWVKTTDVAPPTIVAEGAAAALTTVAATPPPPSVTTTTAPRMPPTTKLSLATLAGSADLPSVFGQIDLSRGDTDRRVDDPRDGCL